MRQRQRAVQARPIVAAFVTIAVAIAVFGRGAAGAASPPDFQELLRHKPYLRLFTESNDCSAIRAVNQLTGAQLETRITELTRWFAHFHSEGSNTWPFGTNCKGSSSTTLAEKLAAGGAVVTNYRNGSYVSQASRGQTNWGEAEMLERAAPLSIATFWPGNAKPYVVGNDGASGGRLVSSVGTGATSVPISTVSSDQRPPDTPASWPFVDSRGAGQEIGAHSQNTHDVVSWLRIDDELMQIVGEPTVADGVIEVPVSRALWGTDARSHAANERVQSPVYIGSSSAATSDSGLSGAPSRNDTRATLRYAIKIWQPAGWRFIADRIAATFGAPGLQGYNGIWLDVSSCNQYNNADWHGNPVFQWNDAASAKFTRDAWGAAQRTKLDGLRSRYPGVWLAGNNLSNNDACTWDLLANAYDGAALEHYMKPGGANLDWSKQIDQTFRIMAGNWPGLFWVRWNYAYTGNVAQYKRFAYGNVLLAYRTGADRPQFGGPFGLQQPDELFRWDLGAPLGAPAGPAELKVPGTNLYRRDYSNAVVFVNPTANATTYPLGTTLWDVNADDSDGLPKAVTSVTIGAYDAALLLKPASDDPAPSAAPSSPSPSPTSGSTPTPANAAPETALSAPASDAQLPADAPVVFMGTVTDDTGVGGVEVSIRDTSTDRWWRSDGTWGNDQGHAATVDAPGSTGSTWSFSWNPPAAGGAFEARATARDVADVEDGSPAVQRFSVGTALTPSSAPSSSVSPSSSPSPTPAPSPAIAPVDTTVTSPAWNTRVGTGAGIRLQGSATHGTAVRKVGVAIKDTERNLWYRADGTWGSWQEFDATLEAPGQPKTAWTFDWAPPRDGEYLFVIRARDTNGNVDPTPAGTKVRATSPHDRKSPETRILSFDARRATATGVEGVRGIVGIASDDRAVRDVLVAVLDRRSGRWWHGDGRWARSRHWSVARLRSDGGWTFRWQVDAGRFRVIAQAVDSSGNVDPTPAVRLLRAR